MTPLAGTKIKICGNTSLADAQLSASAGADFLGFVINHPPSPRNVDLKVAVHIARQISTPVVAVTINKSAEELLAIYSALSSVAQHVILQLHGDEPAELIGSLSQDGIPVWGAATGLKEEVRKRAELLRQAGAEAVLLDVRENKPSGEVIYGGTGKVGDWSLAAQLVAEGYRIVLAGGLTPSNVNRAIQAVSPWMVDVVSGVEASKGVKDPAKVHDFIRAARKF